MALDFKEFSMLRCNKGRSEQELRQIFSMLDENHDGTIDRDEFRKLELCTKEAGAKQVPGGGAFPTFFALVERNL
jgi:Ca2+-binding EF-hand superfamily protein